MLMRIQCILLLFTCLLCDADGSINVDAYDRVVSYLQNKSEALLRRPPEIGSSPEKPFAVTYMMYLIDVLAVDQINQFMSVIAYMQIQWTQKELSWNATEFEKVNKVVLRTTDLWAPKFIVMVGDEESIYLDLNGFLTVDSSGNIQSQVNKYVTFRCEIKFRKYPFDTQTCSFGLYYENLIHSDVYIDPNLTYFPIQTKDFVLPGEWRLLWFNSTIIQDANNQTYPRLTVVVQRQSVYYVTTVVFPMVLTSVMIPLVFLLPTKTGEKISYLVTMFTSTAIFLSYISNVMPRNLSELPYLAVLLIEVMCEGLAAVVATLWVMNMFDNANHINKSVISKIKVHPTEMVTESDGAHSKSAPVYEAFKERVKPVLLDQQNRIRLVDRCLFILFAGFQLIFLSVLFIATDWLK